MTVNDPRPELAAMPAASRPTPPPPLAGVAGWGAAFGYRPDR